MKTKKLGSNGPEISVVGYGAWEIGGDFWGPNPDIDVVLDAMHAGFDAGINWVDTAEIYGSGTSEEIVGRALKGHDDVLVFTKVAPKPAGSGFTPEQIKKACEASLKRLGRDVIDLYQLHWPSSDVPTKSTWAAMASLVDEGKVRSIGVSNFDQKLIEKCESIRHVDALQPEVSMLWRKYFDSGLLDFCERNGTGVIAYGPLAYGLLTGTITTETTFHDKDWRSGTSGFSYYDRLFKPGVIERNLDIVERLRPVADRVGCGLAQLALAWLFHHSQITGAIAGSRKADHVRENAAAGDVVLSTKDIEEIDEVLG